MLDSDDVNVRRRRNIVVVGRALAVLLMEASELVKRRLHGRDHPDHPHVVIPLMGRFKNVTGERNLLLTLASITQSGIEIRKWVEWLIILLMREGRSNRVGPAICEADGFLMQRWKMNGIHSA